MAPRRRIRALAAHIVGSRPAAAELAVDELAYEPYVHGSAPDIVDSSVLSGSAPAGAVGTALHGPSPFVTNQLTNIKPTRTPLSTHLHL